MKFCHICRKEIPHLKKHYKREHPAEYLNRFGKRKLFNQFEKREKTDSLIIENPLYIRRAMERTLLAISMQKSEIYSNLEEISLECSPDYKNGKELFQSYEKEFTPLEKAQDIMYDAWKEQNQTKRIVLARRALAISPDCIDAYVLLAEEQDISLEEAKDLFEQGVKAGERVFGPDFFRENEGHFWEIVSTRPYMRAKFGLAQVLWELGEYKEAIKHYEELLHLNPNDNQGVRHHLIISLLEKGYNDKVEQLLAQYEIDTSACWAYSWALWAFRKFGAGPIANSKLQKALKINPIVPLFLLGILDVPDELPEYFSIGDINEALLYAIDAVKCWVSTPNALEWMLTMTHSYLPLNLPKD